MRGLRLQVRKNCPIESLERSSPWSWMACLIEPRKASGNHEESTSFLYTSRSLSFDTLYIATLAD